jgi:2-amino-4-hydroxy-6-hydroxymethyldihydropteridine diphosphokinase
MHKVYLSIGSNLGDPLQNCWQGLEALCADGQVKLLARSPFYRTQPVDYLDQNWFINAALLVETVLTPLELLDKIRAVQTGMGRKSDAVRYGPRILDLDIIFYDDLVIDTPHLVVPHPRMHKRRFVLHPICDIDPSVVHPVTGLSVREILNQLPTDNQDLVPCSSDRIDNLTYPRTRRT